MAWKDEQSAAEKERERQLLKVITLPKHIAMIMDGNGRWAIGRSMPRVSGHKEGVESVREIVRNCSNLGVKYLTLYAFSIENWKRPTSEVNALMNLLEYFLKKEIKELNENNVIIKTIGKTSALPQKVQKLLLQAIETTKENTGMTLVLALSYSGRWDILRAVQMISLEVRRGKTSPEDITDDFFESKLNTSGIPHPDLVIRTSGEQRLSNFLLWETAYSEIYFSDKLWPEFRLNQLYEALIDYSHRERRFGKTSSQVNKESGVEFLVNEDFLQMNPTTQTSKGGSDDTLAPQINQLESDTEANKEESKGSINYIKKLINVIKP